MSQSAHRVSVIIPVCNVEHYLWQCLVSIQSGLGRALQVIIVDDGSTDRSHEVAERFLEVQPTHANTPEYELVSKPNGGYGSAMNAGLELADGEYVGILEADDYLKGDLFGELSRIARASGDPDIVKSTYWRVMEPDTPEQRTYHSLLRHRGVPTWEEGTIDLGRAPQLVRYHPSIWSAIYRRDFLDATGTRFVEAPGGGWVDNPFMMRTMCQAERIAYTDDAWYCYREDRPGSSSVLKAPEVPLVRWQEMAHEVELSRWANDEGVLSVLYTIAFQHLSHLWDTPAYEGVEELAGDIMRSMRPAIVLGLEEVPPAAKERFLQATGQEPRRVGAGSYRRHLVHEAVHTLAENGPAFALSRARGTRADGGTLMAERAVENIGAADVLGGTPGNVNGAEIAPVGAAATTGVGNGTMDTEDATDKTVGTATGTDALAGTADTDAAADPETTEAVAATDEEGGAMAAAADGKEAPGAVEALADPSAPLVSVIVPAYNVEAYVEQAVRSILGQTMGDLELIVVDDGSTDATGAILDGLATGDARMRVLHVQNGGAPAARNRALDVARGRYVAFADADDECAPTYLEELCRLMEGGCELAICGFTIVTTGGYGEGADADVGSEAGSGARAQSFTEVKSVPSAVYATADEFRAASPELFDNNQLYSPWNKMFVRERLDRLGIRFKDVFWDDFPFVLDYIRDVERVSVTSEPLYTFYRRRADSETARYREGVFEKREEEDRWMRELYAHWDMADDPVADEMVSRRYVERLVGCVANEASPANPKTFGQKRAAVKEMLASPALGHALATAQPRSVKMKIMLLPYRARNATACLLFAMFINWVRTKAPALFARLKAHR